MGLKTKCIDMIYGIATGSRRIRLLLTPVVGLSFLLTAVICILAGLAVDKWLGLAPIVGEPFNRYLGIPLMIAGLVIISWSVQHFVKAKGTPIPINPPSRLVVSGPYVYVRNPMLGGVFVLIFGIGVFSGSKALLFFFAPLFIAVLVTELKTIEEPELAMRLGRSYRNYKRQTPMFFPSLRRLKHPMPQDPDMHNDSLHSDPSRKR